MSPYHKQLAEQWLTYGLIGAFCVVAWIAILVGLVALVGSWW